MLEVLFSAAMLDFLMRLVVMLGFLNLMVSMLHMLDDPEEVRKMHDRKKKWRNKDKHDE